MTPFILSLASASVLFVGLVAAFPQARGAQKEIVCDEALEAIVEGAGNMWPFNLVPRDKIAKDFGFRPNRRLLRNIQLASGRVSAGGSGSFVSESLFITNHHVARQALNDVSTPERNYILNGFYATTRDEEIPVPDVEINVLKKIRDVSADIESALVGIPVGDVEKVQARRNEAIARIEKDAAAKTGMKAEVVTLYKGGKYQLYLYKRYTDIRLVFAPEAASAFFGGDAANFEFPRADLDVTFFRVYEDGKPVRSAKHFKMSRRGARENDLVFISGHPGNTNRLFSVRALEYIRDLSLPATLERLNRRYRAMLQYRKSGGPDAELQSDHDFQSVENALKVYQGEMKGLENGSLLERKRKMEEALRKKVLDDPRLHQFADAWEMLEKAQTEASKSLYPRLFFDVAGAFDTSLFTQARHLVRLAEESQKPNGARLAEYQDARLESLKHSLLAQVPVYKEYEVSKLEASLQFMLDKLGASDPAVQLVLQSKSPAQRARELVDGTQMGDPRFRESLWTGGAGGIASSHDPLILLAKAIDPEARRLREIREQHIETVERLAYQKISLAQFAIFGTGISPDATFTLRLSYGAVKGYAEEDGTSVPSHTTLNDAFELERENGGKDPWALPPTWHQKQGNMDTSVPFNFVSTVDSIGGNSGSPVLNKRGRFVGILFDGNRHSFTKRYAYGDNNRNRAVSVDARAILEALQNVYGATDLVRELLTGP